MKLDNSFNSNSSDGESTMSYKFTDMKHFQEHELCVLDDLTPLQLKMLVLEKIMKMKDVYAHKFHRKRRNSIEVSPSGTVANMSPLDTIQSLQKVSL